MDEALSIIDRLWKGETITEDGPYYRAQGPASCTRCAERRPADLGLRVRAAGRRGRRPLGRRAVDAARSRVHPRRDRGLPRGAPAGRPRGRRRDRLPGAVLVGGERRGRLRGGARSGRAPSPRTTTTRDWHEPREMYEHGEQEMSDEEFAPERDHRLATPPHARRAPARALEQHRAPRCIVAAEQLGRGSAARDRGLRRGGRCPRCARRCACSVRRRRVAPCDGAAPLAASRRRGARGGRDAARPARRRAPDHQPRLLARASRPARAPAGGGHRRVRAGRLRARDPRPAARRSRSTTTRSRRASCSAPRSSG